MRRARFPIELDVHETIPGGLARSIRLNVLERASVALSDARLPQRRIGLTQLMTADELTSLATFLRCDPEPMIRQAGIVGDGTVAFGDLHLLRGDVELDRRRIAPRTLRDMPFHRHEWLIRLLPYCPVSLERLVEACPECGSALTWSRCWGIGVCEWCRTPVAPSPDQGLEEAFADGYRLFSHMLSPVQQTRHDALGRLPEQLRQIVPGTLVNMAIRLGQVCRPEPIRYIRRAGITQLAPNLLADVIATGTSMLRGWPDTFIAWGTDNLASRIDDLPGYHGIRTDIRRLGNPRFESETQASLVRDALPHEFASFARSAPVADFMTGLELKTVAHLRPNQLALLRPSLEDRRLPSIRRQRSQFNPDKVLQFGAKYHESRKLTDLTFELMLPLYALEQMVCDGELDEERDELVRLARGATCVTGGALDKLVRRIRSKQSRNEKPESVVSLAAASRRIGGRQKPWSAIFRALRKGQISFWLDGDKVTSRSILVHPASLARFEGMTFRREDHPAFQFTNTCAKFEAEEILNLAPKNLEPFIEAGHLAFRPEGRRLVTDLCDVLDLAARMVAFAELAAHTGWTYWRACDETDELGLGRIGIGWCRATLVSTRLVPVVPGSVEDCIRSRPPAQRAAGSTRVHGFAGGSSYV